ncbi:MAG: carboxypeptidase [Gemmatimonadota bacterium]|nr:carboxypeptidase [Gemmatimonadota bacterium]MDH5198122.1 carboxypeptidase [Gemmatimonadota bacterium]
MRIRLFSLVLILGSCLVAAIPAAAQQVTPPAPRPAAMKAGAEADLLPDEPVVTQHTARINGQSVSYTAEAGWLPIRDDGKTVAKMFYIAYTRNGVQDLAARPLVFSFNGGPGTASVWMHMGYTGPRRVVYDDEGFAPMPPGQLEDNPHSILDAADIVYIDPVPTGFSRMIEGEDLHKYHGTIPDVESVAELIRLWVVRKDRWMSPKFVIGESYGTTRASALAGYLVDRHQLYLNGVILVSMTDLGIEQGPDVAYATSLPQMTATAWYHRQLPADLQGRPLREVLDESEAFALGDYLAALVQGDRLDDARRTTIAQQVARYTGLTVDYVQSANLRITTRRFWKELLRDQRLTVGRLDSRYLGIDQESAGENPEYDPAIADWNGPFANAVNRYLREELQYNPDLQYNIWGNVRPWDRTSPTPPGEMLREAMRENPYLKVMIQTGYFDAATDYFGAQYTISHIQPGGEFRDRFRFRFYESGHMMYLRKPDLANANNDLRDFLRWSLEGVQDYPRRAR